MNQLYHIIRRARRPLVEPEAVPASAVALAPAPVVANVEPVIPEVPPVVEVKPEAPVETSHAKTLPKSKRK